MQAGVKIFDALDFGEAVSRVLKSTWKENMHTSMKIFDALDFGAAVNRALKSISQEIINKGMKLFDALYCVEQKGYLMTFASGKKKIAPR